MQSVDSDWKEVRGLLSKPVKDNCLHAILLAGVIPCEWLILLAGVTTL